MSDAQSPETASSTDPTLERLRRFALGISIGRLVAATLLAWLILSDHRALAFWLLILAGLGALLEGSLALFFHTRTRATAILDGLADRSLPVVGLICLTLANLLPLWVLILLALRELALGLGQKLPMSAGNLPWIREPAWLSHTNIVLADLLVIAILAVQGPGLGLDAYLFPLELLIVAIALLSLAVAFLRRPRAGDEADDIGDGTAA